ncbi:MAG: VWA domain-containing protein [Promethearchaeota archaeon]
MITEEESSSDDVPIVLSGSISDEKLFESEIRTKGRDFQYFLRLGRSFDYPTAKQMAEIAIELGNIPALQALAQLQPIATSEAISTQDGVHLIAKSAREGNVAAPLLFFQLRNQIRGQYKQTFRQLARATIIHSALRISGRGLRPENIKQVPFHPGLDEFDLEATLEETLLEPNFINYSDIIGIERIARKKVGTIILDTSGSMAGPKLLTAATAAAVAAYHLRHDKYALIVFNTAANIIKAMDQYTTIDHIVDTILDTEPAGYTNINDALKQAFTQYQRANRFESWAILITDGIANRGGPPEPQARKFHNLHVLQTPGTHPQGEETCQQIAQLGRGRHIKVNSYREVPRALIRLLQRTIVR